MRLTRYAIVSFLALFPILNAEAAELPTVDVAILATGIMEYKNLPSQIKVVREYGRKDGVAATQNSYANSVVEKYFRLLSADSTIYVMNANGSENLADAVEQSIGRVKLIVSALSTPADKAVLDKQVEKAKANGIVWIQQLPKETAIGIPGDKEAAKLASDILALSKKDLEERKEIFREIIGNPKHDHWTNYYTFMGLHDPEAALEVGIERLKNAESFGEEERCLITHALFHLIAQLANETYNRSENLFAREHYTRQLDVLAAIEIWPRMLKTLENVKTDSDYAEKFLTSDKRNVERILKINGARK